MNFKKLLSLLLVLVTVVVIAACAKEVTVTFEANGGSVVAAKTVKAGETIPEPVDPEKEGFTFTGWFKDEALTEPFTFSTKIEANLKLYAGWTLDVVVRFNTQSDASIPTVELGAGQTVDKPQDPTRTGYRFAGWFRGKSGLTWLEPEAVSFPLTVNESMTLFAYWEPLNSKTVDYTNAETYITSVTEGTSLILNPLVYQWSHENDFINMLVTPLYTTEVDWATAIKAGVANYVGDFSKIIGREFSVEALDYHQIKVGATNLPIDENGNEHLTPEGGYDRDNASTINSNSWTFKLRQDLKFEDGTPITAHTFEYSIKQYLDPKQNNYRSTSFYQDEVELNGYPITNAAEYRKQLVNGTTVSWDDVGFEVLDDYTFKVTFWKPTSQSSAVGLANTIRLVQPTIYAQSLTNGINSTYGTPDVPYVSYGAYVIKSWDENQMIVFNKNYDYVARDTINYKSQVIQIVESISMQTDMYKDNGNLLSVLGLSNENYAEFAEEDNLKRGWNGFPQYITMNLGGSRVEGGGHEQPEIMFDKRFRQAMFFGFDRNYYNASVYAPNVPSILPIPSDAKAYLQDALLFGESPQHLAILAKHNIDASTFGYTPQRAQQLFNAAYADWVADGNTGPVVLKMVSSNATDLNIALAEYIKDNYETLFNEDNPGRFEIDIQYGSTAATTQAQREWEFDIALLNVGFGDSTGSQWQYPFIAYLGADLGGANLGLSQPYDVSEADGKAAYLKEILTVDLTNTYNYLAEVVEDEDVLEEYVELFEKLKEDGDKAAGIYKGELGWLASYNVGNTPWDALAAEPFNGATQDIWNMLAAFEDVFFTHVPMVPTATRASATVYKDYVVITWPEYSVAFGWGANRYRYLDTDPNFTDGMYNAFKVAYEATK